MVRTPCIEVKNIKKRYGSLEAVKDISFSVEQGSIFGMLGPNGAGKSTTIAMLLGLKRRDAGAVSVLGLDPEVDGSQLKSKVSAQLQSPALFGRLSVQELLGLFASFYPEPASVEDTIAMVQLQDKRHSQADSLSGGQKHRLAVGLAIVANTDIVFLDEPTTGLDPQTRRSIWDVMLHLRSQGRIVVLTTHYMDEAEKLCDQLIIVDQGTVVAQGRPRDLISSHFPQDALEFVNPDFSACEMERLCQIDGVVDHCMAAAGEVVLYSKNASSTLAGLQELAGSCGRQLAEINLRRPTLDDLFLKITGRMMRS